MSNNFENSMLHKVYAEAMQENADLKLRLKDVESKEAKDKRFIISLCEQIWDMVNGGTFYGEDYEKIEKELKVRGIDPDDLFVY